MKYLCDPEVVPTVVPQDIAQISVFGNATAAYSTWMHVDVDDGIFAPALTWPYASGAASADTGALDPLPTALSLEAHLMVAAPLRIGERLARAGVKRIIAHIEAFATPESGHEALAAFRAAGASEVGLALKIDTPLSAIDGFAGECDVIQLMSIATIGSQGQAFEDRVLARVEELHAHYPDMMVAVDGGVSEATVEELVRAGANRLVVGHALSSSTDPALTYTKILERAMRGCAPRILETAI